ncbi:MAG: hypothetical protein M5U28_11260 [Sandaracinaceae bacterium]|nr:hypothetical protein [Sandaracinaceae bacterium]
MDDGVAQRDVVRVVEEAARAAAGEIEVLEDVVVAGRLDGVGAAGDARPRAGADAAHHDGHGLRARIVEADAARVVGVALDLDDVAGLEGRQLRDCR